MASNDLRSVESRRATTKPFKWDAGKRKAAVLLAEAELSTTAIAAEVGVGRETLWKWRQHPEFRARVKEISDRLDEDVYESGLARQRLRVQKLQALAAKVERALERGDELDPALVRQYRGALDDIAKERGHRAATLRAYLASQEQDVHPVVHTFVTVMPADDPEGGTGVQSEGR